MHLLSHSILCCRVKTCPSQGKNSLAVDIKDFKDTPRTFSVALLQKLLALVDYALVLSLADRVKIAVPATKEDVKTEDEQKAVFKLISEIDIIDGELSCKDCSRRYPIMDGIPNLILEDDEI